MLRYLLYFALVCVTLAAKAGVNIDMTIGPKYQDNLEAFIKLHKNLTEQERNMNVALGAAAVEMEGVKSNGSNYSSHEQLLEKRLNDPLHYVQLGVQLGNIIAQVAYCAKEYADFTEWMAKRVKVMPDVIAIWTSTSNFVTKEIVHASKLAAMLSTGLLLASRSTSAEKAQLMWSLRLCVEKMRNGIRQATLLGSCHIQSSPGKRDENWNKSYVISDKELADLKRKWWTF